MSLSVLRSYCPQKWRPFFSEEVLIGSPSPPRSGTGSGGGAGGMAQQLSSFMQAIETLTIAQTKSLPASLEIREPPNAVTSPTEKGMP